MVTAGQVRNPDLAGSGADGCSARRRLSSAVPVRCSEESPVGCPAAPAPICSLALSLSP